MKKTCPLRVAMVVSVVLFLSCGVQKPNASKPNESTQTEIPSDVSADASNGTIAGAGDGDVEVSLLKTADTADFAALDLLADDLEKDGTIDREIAVLEKQAAETDAPPSVFIALSVLYGRKNLKTKEYAALASAEESARRPGVAFNVALLYGRKKLLEGSPDAASFMVGTLIVETTPQGASLSLDGKESGKTPVTLDKVTASSHTLSLTLANYSPITLRPEIKVGGTTRISRVLVPAGEPGPKNQILNDGFEYDFQEKDGQWWELYSAPDKANFAAWERDNTTAVKGKSSVKISIAKINGTAWEPHAKIIGLNVERGKKYTYSVFLKADRPCRVVFDIRRFSEEIFYGNSEILTIGEEWKEYSCTVVASETNRGDAMVLTQLGRDGATVWMDNARFYEGEYHKE